MKSNLSLQVQVLDNGYVVSIQDTNTQKQEHFVAPTAAKAKKVVKQFFEATQDEPVKE